MLIKRTSASIQTKGLDSELGAAPVSSLGVVLDGVVRLESDPLGDRLVGLLLHSQGALGTERLLGRLWRDGNKKEGGTGSRDNRRDSLARAATANGVLWEKTHAHVAHSTVTHHGGRTDRLTRRRCDDLNYAERNEEACELPYLDSLSLSLWLAVAPALSFVLVQ